jgi:hypothetical protein
VVGNATYGINVSFGHLARITSSEISGNGEDGVRINGDSALVTRNRADGNGFPYGRASDLHGAGIVVNYFNTAPRGSNIAQGNDDPAECVPALLC